MTSNDTLAVMAELRAVASFVKGRTMGAFNTAVKEGRLSKDPNASNYAGHYMYMFTDAEGDHFKNIITRKYVVNPLA